jgi:NAD(P)-dependent dehydrogenase (short-subunit alcohol dehydrogenase family)
MSLSVITGANRGIGLALATQYSARGSTVVATARDPAHATELQELARRVPALEVVALDVTSPQSIAAFKTALGRRPIDVLIANAGAFVSRGGIQDPENTYESWTELMAVNVTGAFLTIHALVENVVSAAGKIAIISSQMGSSIRAAGNAYPYRASKAAAANMAANLAVEMKPRGVAVAAFHPGWVRTGMGGSGADISVEESASGLIRRIDHLSLATTGAFEDYTGKPIAF